MAIRLTPNKPMVLGGKTRGIPPSERHSKHTTHCSHCNRDMGTFASGYARGGPNFKILCHPNVPGRPDCYQLVTIYKHEQPCSSSTCYEDDHELLDYVDNHGKKTKTSK